jgi:hypothetical protein
MGALSGGSGKVDMDWLWHILFRPVDNMDIMFLLWIMHAWHKQQMAAIKK